MAEGSDSGYGKIILLHGASSSGKSTIARALQTAIDAPFLHVSIDHLRDAGVLPSARIGSGEFEWAQMRGAFFDGFHQSLAAFARTGNNLIVEHILDTKGWLRDLVLLFSSFDVFFVGIHCSLAELVRREAARGDRKTGSAEHDYRNVHQGLGYDWEIQSEAPLEENLLALIQSWETRPSPSVFAQLARVWANSPSTTSAPP